MTLDNQPINSHITDYLNYYCGLAHAPGFAVLLKGQWGAGKTWFIKKYCENLKKNKQKCLYISLYGMTSFAEIEYAFFQQLHPVLSSKGMEITNKIFKVFLKGTLKIDLDGDGKDDGTLNVQIPEINLPEYLKNTDKSILIFDDLERCNIDLSNMLGYINYFVEHQDLKVLIVANEDELINNANYTDIKEKLIGKTFCISLDFEGALESFIKLVNNSNVRKFLSKNTELIQNLYSKAECENLRILKQIFLDFERIFNELPEKAKNKQETLQNILKLLIAFSIEIKRGKIIPKDIIQLEEQFASLLTKEIMSPQASDSVTEENNEERTPIQTILKKYPTLNLHDPFPNLVWWEIFFDKGIIDTQELENSLSTNKYFQDENTPNWVKLWHFHDLTDDEFDTLLKKVESDYADRKFKELEEIKHVTGLLLKFCAIELYNKTKEEILNDSKLYIDYLKDNERISLKKNHFIAHKSISPITWNSDSKLGFVGKDIEEFQELCFYIDEVIESVKVDMMQTAAQNLLDTMQNNVWKFYEMICSTNLQNRNFSQDKYYKTPILKYIEPSNFVAKFLSMNPKDQSSIIYIIAERYDYYQEKLIEELEWLKEVRSLLQNEANSRKGKLSQYRFKLFIEKNLNKVIDKIEAQE
ncbi:MAG: NTPase [Symploca sp. SIO2C1]|nr:NTPase [Symploca sp. SIO2C1]